jgi:3-methyl-2-oxobutanoate hydroxymethyltransferase
MVFAGYENTLPVTVDHIFYHASAVRRGAQHSLIVADMPFLSYQINEDTAVANCGRFIKEGVAQAVKIEGGSPSICSLVARLVAVGIPVMGHVGLTPQLLNTIGGFRTQGKQEDEAGEIREAAIRLEKAGAFCVVLEAIPTGLARQITESVSVPTIGIGAGPHCDGQVLVVSDIVGMFDSFKPKFARRYAEVGHEIRKAAAAYVEDVRQGRFPNESESYQ